MTTCKHCGEPISRKRNWPSGTEQWFTNAIVCGAFCPAVEGRPHEPRPTLNLAHLTVTQFSAYVELNRRSSLYPAGRAWARDTGARQFARRTLQVLVDSGVAQWVTQDGLMPRIIPVAEPTPAIQADTQLSERSYCIGVPLAITVHNDGRVEFEVDLAEAPLDEHDTEHSDADVYADQQLLDTVLASIKYSHTF